MITQSRNALGNLINRYRAVLHKCRLCNVFGSLAVAGMLVIGGAGTASSTVYHTQITGTEQDYDAIKTIDGDMVTYTFKEGDSLEVIEQSGINVGNGNIYNITIKNNLDIHISQENTSASLKGITIGKDNAIFNMDGGSISITSKNSQSFKFAAPKGVFVWSKNAEVSLGDMNIYIEESNTQYAAEARGIDINYQNTVTLGNASLTVQAVNEQGMAEDFVRAAGMSADGTSGANEVKADSLFIQADAKGNKEVKAWGVGLTRGSIGSIGNGDITASAVSRGSDEKDMAWARGIYSGDGSQLVKGNGSITATAEGKVTVTAYGIHTYGANSQISVETSDIVTRTEGEDADSNNVQSVGILAKGGTITLKGGSIDASSNNTESFICGVWATEGGQVTLGSEGKSLSISASGSDAARGIDVDADSSLSMNGAVSIDAPVALRGSGAVENNGNFTITEGTVNTFTGVYTQKAGSTVLQKDNGFFKSDVVLAQGPLTYGTVDTSAADGAKAVLGLGEAITVPNGKKLLVGTVDASATGVTFGADSALVVSGAAAVGRAMITSENPATPLNVEAGAQLYILDAKAGESYTITQGFDTQSYWTDAVDTSANRFIALSPTQVGDAMIVQASVVQAAEALPGVEASSSLDSLIAQNLNDTQSSDMGIRFLSRVIEPLYMPDDARAADTINEVSRAAATAGVQNTALRLTDAAADAVVRHMSLGRFDEDNTVHRDGVDFWVAPLYGSLYTHGMGSSGEDVRGDFAGVALGVDAEAGRIAGGEVRVGMALHGGGGTSHNGGAVTETQNTYNFFGAHLYAGWNLEHLNFIAALGYSRGRHDVSMSLPSELQMGSAKADVTTSALTADFRAEYQFVTDWLDIMPHVGVRYTSLYTYDYEFKVNDAPLNRVDGDRQDIVQFPVGISLTKDIEAADWVLKPQLDVSFIPVAGDTDAVSRVTYAGVNASDSIDTRIMDASSWSGLVGLQAEKGNLTIGLNYSVQASYHETNQQVQLNLGWKF